MRAALARIYVRALCPGVVPRSTEAQPQGIAGRLRLNRAKRLDVAIALRAHLLPSPEANFDVLLRSASRPVALSQGSESGAPPDALPAHRRPIEPRGGRLRGGLRREQHPEQQDTRLWTDRAGDPVPAPGHAIRDRGL